MGKKWTSTWLSPQRISVNDNWNKPLIDICILPNVTCACTHAHTFFFQLIQSCDNNPAKSELLLFSFNNGDHGRAPKFNLMCLCSAWMFSGEHISTYFIIKREVVHKNINSETKQAPGPRSCSSVRKLRSNLLPVIPTPAFEPLWDSAPNVITVSILVMLMKRSSLWYFYHTGVLKVRSGNLWGSEML